MRPVPSHSGYGVVTRPYIDRPVSMFNWCCVAWICPPLAGTDGFDGVFCSE
jgi:hypothetical protein